MNLTFISFSLDVQAYNIRSLNTKSLSYAPGLSAVSLSVNRSCTISQRCGLSRDISVSRRSRDVLTSRLSLVSVSNRCVSGLVSISEQYVSVSAQ